MSREILFRGKALIGGEWIYGGYTYDDADKDHMITQVNEDGLVIGYVVDEDTVGQFTGLTDKNGVKIWEGDVMETVTKDWKSWAFGGFEGDTPPSITKRDFVTLQKFRYWLSKESFGYEGEDLENPADWWVVGNRFDNPELIQPRVQK